MSNILKLFVKDLQTYKTKDLQLLAKKYGIATDQSRDNLIATIAYKHSGIQSGAMEPVPPVPQGPESSKIGPAKYNSGGYIYLYNNEQVYANDFLAGGGLEQLLYTRDNLSQILDPKVPDTTFKYWDPYAIQNARRYGRKTVANTLPEIERMIGLFMTHQYKIHLQPSDGHFYETVQAIKNVIKDHPNHIEFVKYTWSDPSTLVQLYPNNPPPAIVVYPVFGHAAEILQAILGVTDPKWGSGVRPRGNIKVNNLVYYAGGDWSLKSNLATNYIFNDDLTLYRGQEKLV